MNQLNIPLEKLLNASEGSIYKVTLLAAKRAMALADGEKPLIEKASEKILDNALREIRDGKIKVKGK
ncbi:MAG: DNA-directed RNA polymerase subunit omega [Candidatus Omnitrophica bacterium]|nr:DNA-directed RNA polymerase subunit omega [Candidatus Omnitrophota bacterium]MDD5430098.1 DNA-directed RNA polymerase subunit omega [Candidatus Omnitrophota bacterium]